MKWHILHLRPRSEKKTEEYCRAHSLSTYLPLRRETKVYQRRKVTVEKPVFPGYLFVRFDAETRVTVLKTNNVVRILEAPDQRGLLHELAQVRKALAVDPTLGACDALREGRRVKITAGPFMGIEGVVSGLKGHAKVRLNVDMIGQAIGVEVDRDFLQAID